MKTIFKKGMVVYDQMFFPDVEGKIIEIHDKYDKIQIEVKFFSKYRLEPLCMQSSVFYTENGNMINFLGYNCGTSTLSTSPYNLEMQGFEQKEPVPTYESIRAEGLKKGENVTILNGLELPDDKTAEAFKALAELIWLRNYYNEGWQPNWKDNSYKEILCFEADFHSKKDFKYRFYASKSEPRVLAFKNSEIRKKFFEDQKELLEIAKPLL